MKRLIAITLAVAAATVLTGCESSAASSPPRPEAKPQTNVVQATHVEPVEPAAPTVAQRMVGTWVHRYPNEYGMWALCIHERGTLTAVIDALPDSKEEGFTIYEIPYRVDEATGILHGAITFLSMPDGPIRAQCELLDDDTLLMRPPDARPGETTIFARVKPQYQSP